MVRLGITARTTSHSHEEDALFWGLPSARLQRAAFREDLGHLWKRPFLFEQASGKNAIDEFIPAKTKANTCNARCLIALWEFCHALPTCHVHCKKAVCGFHKN